MKNILIISFLLALYGSVAWAEPVWPVDSVAQQIASVATLPISVNGSGQTASLCEGQPMSATVIAPGAISYFWEMADTTLYWYGPSALFSGQGTATLQTTAITTPPWGSVWYFRCITNNGLTFDTSAICTVQVSPSPLISQQPDPTFICAGNTGLMGVGVWYATSYQWQVSDPWSNFFTDVSGPAYTGANTAVLQFTNSYAISSGDLYRCIVSNGQCADTSVAAPCYITLLAYADFYVDGTNTNTTWMPVEGNLCDTMSVSISVPFGMNGIHVTISGTSGVDYQMISHNYDSTQMEIKWLSYGYHQIMVDINGYNGCASSDNLTIDVPATWPPSFWATPPASQCAGDTANFSLSAMYTSPLVWHLPPNPGTDYMLLSGGGPYDHTLSLKWLTPGTRTVSVNYTDSCNSPAATVTTLVGNGASTALNQTICAGDSVVVGGQSFSQSGIYTVTVPNQTGCDSVITLSLTVHPVSATALNQTICAGDSVVVGGQSFSQSGVYTVTVPNQTGCDSVISLSLTVHPMPIQPSILRNTDTLMAVSSDSITWFLNGSMLATGPEWVMQQNGVYVACATNLYNCTICSDSLLVGNVAVETGSILRFHLWPNPTTGLLMLRLPADSPLASATFTDVTGRVLSQFSVTPGEHSLDLSLLPAGVYVLRMGGGSVRVVKQ